MNVPPPPIDIRTIPPNTQVRSVRKSRKVSLWPFHFAALFMLCGSIGFILLGLNGPTDIQLLGSWAISGVLFVGMILTEIGVVIADAIAFDNRERSSG